ncbi:MULTISPECIES: flagellar motor switch protein FliG [unclassified Arthrobacter]|uniref:flagellar motor switch protein FliG n=1 Tax=unclassified Arthrobacter TaxID=235627 RepID=UPI002105E61B|nr:MULTISPECIES: flagellar motor switch protein FliG [unclassified Arthrobacter]UWX82243.1 flagellar motor switch protein FliG [Arthrobacter sp. zg-Y1171]
MTDLATAPAGLPFAAASNGSALALSGARTDAGSGELTGTQKAAIILMQLETSRAAVVMQQFTEAEAQAIAAEIVRLRRVDSSVAEEAINEFYEMTIEGRRRAHGGRDVAMGLLEASFGVERASGVMERLASSMAGKSFEFLETAEPNQVISLLDGELPQTIALVLAHMRPQRASAVLTGLSAELRTDVAQAIATMARATPEAVRVVAETLRARASALGAAREATDAIGGVQPLVEIINRSDAVTERALLEALEERDPELAEEVRSRMLTFADLVKLERRDVQLVLRGIDVGTLALAMKGASEAVLDAIRTNVSERNRELLDDEIKVSGPARLSQVEEARANIVRAIREMEAQGIIEVHHADEEEYVY